MVNADIEKEFLEAYDALSEPLYRHCFFRVFSESKAEDLVQETFMKTWQYISKGHTVENLKAFLYRVANNLVIDYSRKKKEDSLDSILADLPQLEPSYDGKKEIERDVLLAQVFEVIHGLPDDVRQLLLLRYGEDLDAKEIAQILKITPNNASVRLNRAHKLLQDLLDR